MGRNLQQDAFWDELFTKIAVLPFDENVFQHSVRIYRKLKSQSKLIEMPDILIAATALANNISVATLNVKDFSRIEGLEIIDL